MKIDRILVLAPHTDDAELACGASIAYFLEQGSTVLIAAFSTAEQSLPPGSASTRLREEFFHSIAALGLSQDNAVVFNYPVRQFSYNRQAILDDLLQLRRDFQPGMILVPSSGDVHQDHQVIHDEGVRAFKERIVWGYDMPWNSIRFCSQAFVKVERRHLETKWAALRCYTSQLELGRSYCSWEFIESLARVRGLQIKALYAEAYEVVRIVY